MRTKLVYSIGMFCSAVAALALAGRIEAQAPQEPPPARKIPGVTAKDLFPRACVDCHINYVDMNLDTRFSTLLNRWREKPEPGLLAKAEASAPQGMTLKGKHPEAAGALKDIPAKCLACHGKGSKTAPPFANLIHSIHLTGGEENHFLTVFQGECTHCHKLNQKTGHWTIPSAPER
jgi:hypothetical protein